MIVERTAAEWREGNPILTEGTVGVESDTGKKKRGDGVSPWAPLNYIEDPVTETPPEPEDNVIHGGTP